MVGQALAAATAGTELPLVTTRDGEIVGSTRFLALRPEHGSVEIGWTWLHPSAWGTGTNVDAKLLQLGHAFEEWGCRRVGLKTDALNAVTPGARGDRSDLRRGSPQAYARSRSGENRDSAWYSVTDDEWPAVRAQLETRLAAGRPTGLHCRWYPRRGTGAK